MILNAQAIEFIEFQQFIKDYIGGMWCGLMIPISVFAVIDDEIIWHGGINLLGKEDIKNTKT